MVKQDIMENAVWQLCFNFKLKLNINSLKIEDLVYLFFL